MKLICNLLLLAPLVAFGEVTNKGETGFNLVISGEVAVTPEAAYNQFVKVDEWWVESHSYFGDRKNFSLDASAGGCFCEISGDKEVMHMQVTFVSPGEELKMIGGLGPLQMLGIHGGMSWRFTPTETGTQIVQTYNVTGYLPGGLSDLADIVDAVQTSQLNALIQKIESD